ncbi:hypothetical protein Zm00014a_005657 [Zea mays]|uniref:Uncharacterized protein n=1 Tax=Zea mays TaxID=4577 RepID=A0A3L6G4S8_MAIZE|nr:hypothetical protein Zm00014a_005657 [Zea mays]
MRQTFGGFSTCVRTISS